MTHLPAAVAAYALEVTTAVLSQLEAIAAVRWRLEATAAALSQLEATAAARSLYVVGATAIGAPTPIAVTPTEPVRRQWARLRSVQLRRGLTTAAAAATTPTATGFARNRYYPY
jgi:hypothetical protein